MLPLNLVDINQKRIYGAALIKKRRYLPHYIFGKNVKVHFSNTVVGAVDEIFGELNNVPLISLP